MIGVGPQPSSALRAAGENPRRTGSRPWLRWNPSRRRAALVAGTRRFVDYAAETSCLLTDLLLPRTCDACGTWLPERGVRLCARCAAGLAGCVGGEYCRLCAADVGPYLMRDGRCGDCRARRPALSRLARVGRYEGALRDMILGFKHDRRLAGPLGRLLAEVIERELSSAEPELLVPVPSPWRRRVLRGFHPTGLLAREAARRVGLSWAAALEMARPMRPQVGLSATERAANVRGAFRPAPGKTAAGRRVCVLDDVCTTGATLREAARMLCEAGAESVVGVVLARTSDTSAAIVVPETSR